MAEPSTRGGFGLIEAVVALAVLGIVLGGAFATTGSSLGVAERARRELAMAALAESLLERAGLDLLVDETVAEGRAEGFVWRLERTPLPEPEGRPQRPGERRPRLWRIEARVEDGRNTFSLVTLELASPP